MCGRGNHTKHALLTRFCTISVAMVWIKLIMMSPCSTGFNINCPKNRGHILQFLQLFFRWCFPVAAKLCFNFHLHGKYFVVQRVHWSDYLLFVWPAVDRLCVASLTHFPQALSKTMCFDFLLFFAVHEVVQNTSALIFKNIFSFLFNFLPFT